MECSAYDEQVPEYRLLEKEMVLKTIFPPST